MHALTLRSGCTKEWIMSACVILLKFVSILLFSAVKSMEGGGFSHSGLDAFCGEFYGPATPSCTCLDLNTRQNQTTNA